MSSMENPENSENPDVMQKDPPLQESSWANGSDPLPDREEPVAADHSETNGEEFEFLHALKILINILGVKLPHSRLINHI